MHLPRALGGEAGAVGPLYEMEIDMQIRANNWMSTIKKPIFTPIGVYLLSIILPATTLGLPFLLFNWTSDYLNAHLYIIGTLGQLLMDLPAVILFSRLHIIPENSGQNKTRDRIISIIAGIGCAMLLAAFRVLAIGHLMGSRFMGGVPAFTQSLDLGSPWNIISAGVALLAYGPGEALFVVYLILAFDKVVGGSHKIISWGVIITSILWALPHFLNIIFFGLSAVINVLIMLFIGIIMGVLLKKTRSSLGPIIFWTLANGTSI